MEMRPKPSRIISAVGSIAIILGGLGSMRTLGMMWELFFPHMSTRRTSLIELINQGIFNCSLAYFKGRVLVGLVLCVLLIISGVGVLKLRKWARKLMLGVSATSAGLCVDYAVRNAALRVDSPIHVRLGMTFAILLCGLWFYVLAVWVLTRSTVREQFEETTARQEDS